MIEIERLTRTFRKAGRRINAVDGVSWRAERGTFSVVYGRSGSGKSTLLMMLGGMLTPTEGRITVAGRDLYGLPRRRRNAYRRGSVGFIFQKFLLLPYFTVYDNIALPLALNRTAAAREKILAIAGELELLDRIDHYPAELSVGQQQRVAMARALVKDPELILADEPTGNLDGENAEVILRNLRAAADAGKTVVAATHDARLLGGAQQKLRLEEGRGSATA
jgi:ABC-type lipoprotein export system ATPase subunit